MNDSKFAPMTAGLLARKGFAAPSVLAGPTHASWEGYGRPSALRAPDAAAIAPAIRSELAQAVASVRRAVSSPTDAPAAHVEPAGHSHAATKRRTRTTIDPDLHRRVMVLVTGRELEALAIAAIKKGKTRHEIVREALDAYLVRLASELPGSCRCLMGASAATVS